MKKVKTQLVIDNGVRLITSEDFIDYYNWFIKKEFPWLQTNKPKYLAHVTLVNPLVHGVTDFSEIEYLNGTEHWVDYSVEIYRSPRNFWLPVATPEVYHEVKYFLNFKEKYDWLGLHFTISNTKVDLRAEAEDLFEAVWWELNGKGYTLKEKIGIMDKLMFRIQRERNSIQ